MKTITVRDLRLHWPSIEKQLAGGSSELIVTRDSRPVAKLSALPPEKKAARPRLTAELHARWMKEIWGEKPPKTRSDRWLNEDRAERFSRAR